MINNYNSWPMSKLSDVCERIVSGGTPSRRHPEYYLNGKWPWIKTQELLDCVLTTSEEFITDEALRASSAKVLEPGTILVAMYGATIGQLGIVGVPLTCNQACAAIKTNDRKLQGRFLYYYLKSNRKHLKDSAIGAAQQNLNVGFFRDLIIPLPPLPEQQAIAEVLGALDDKIELNRKMNATLDELARTIFRSWFVDFDPVRAKMEGREPFGMDAATAALFPDTLIDSELGPIPEGWDVADLSSCCTTQYGYTASATTERTGFQFLRVMDINKSNWIDWSSVPNCVVEEKARSKYLLHEGDVVVARMADPGKAAIIEEPISAVFASYLVRLKFRTLAWSYFGYGFLKSDPYQEYAASARGGSVQANMNARVIVGAKLAVPDTNLVDAYFRAIKDFRQLIVSNLRESRTLAELRDTLLPELISGRIRVPVAERLVGEVV